MMKKSSTKGFVILVILFILISVIAFVVPTVKTNTFWIAYAFTIFVFASQIWIWKTAFGRAETLRSKFLGLPIVYIGVSYLIIQTIAFVFFLLVPTLPTWSAFMICGIIACLSVVFMIGADTGRNEIEQKELKVQKKVFYIKNMQTDIELMADIETDNVVKTSLIQLAEKIQFSDPMGNEHLADLEDRISAKIAELKTATNKSDIINELNSLLDERNKKCKILK